MDTNVIDLHIYNFHEIYLDLGDQIFYAGMLADFTGIDLMPQPVDSLKLCLRCQS